MAERGGMIERVKRYWYDGPQLSHRTRLSHSGMSSAPLVSSAAVVNLGQRDVKLPTVQEWQRRAWEMHDLVGEVGYSSDYVGNSAAKVRLYAGVRPEPDEDPIPVSDAAKPDEGREALITEQVARIAEDAVERLRSPSGGFHAITRPLAVNRTVVGECYLVGLDNGDGTETWEIRSVDEIRRAPQGKPGLVIVDDPDKPNSGGRPLIDGRDLIVRLWTRHPRYVMRADSALRRVLGTCEELLDLSAAARSIIRSRIAMAGLLKVPNALGLGPQDPTQATGNQDGKLDPILDALIQHMTTPIRDPNSAAATVPMMVRGDIEALKGLEHMELNRPFDEQLTSRADAALKRLAQGLNVPVEVVLGVADVNHWTAWYVGEDAWKAHIEPGTVQDVEGLTVGYLRPALLAAGVQPDVAKRVVLWYDPSDLIVRPMSPGDVHGSVDRAIIGPSAARRRLGFDESDAPTDEEMQLLRDLKRPQVVGRDDGGQETEPEAPPAEEPEQEDPEDGAQSTTAAALVAAADDAAQIGRQLAGLDRTLRDRLYAAADASLRRALDRAGAKLVGKARRDKAAAAILRKAQQYQAAMVLGPSMVRGLGVSDDELLAGAFDELAERFDTWCQQTAEAALRLVPDLQGDQLEYARDRLADLRTDAWDWLSAELTKLANQRLYDPDPAAPEVGEYDSSLTVPFGIIREAVARAGGSMGPEGPVTAGLMERLQRAAGLATGWLMRKQLATVARIEVVGYEWQYGSYPRERPFEPHMALDGLVFESFVDPQLENTEGWPPEEFYSPGDHEGCVCDTVPITASIQEPIAATGSESDNQPVRKLPATRRT